MSSAVPSTGYFFDLFMVYVIENLLTASCLQTIGCLFWRQPACVCVSAGCWWQHLIFSRYCTWCVFVSLILLFFCVVPFVKSHHLHRRSFVVPAVFSQTHIFLYILLLSGKSRCYATIWFPPLSVSQMIFSSLSVCDSCIVFLNSSMAGNHSGNMLLPEWLAVEL